MSDKKVLLLTYYWPPSGGAGVQRCLKYAKYLSSFGWEPVVYTAENGHYPILDPSLEKDIPPHITVLKHPIWEPYGWYKKFLGMKKEERVQHGFIQEKESSTLKQKISVWIRGNFFIPDARCFWIRPSIKFLTAWLQKNPVDAILSSGPPHSMHLIARGLKRKTGIPWLADFRDPWTHIDFYDQLMLSSRADRKHKKLEKSVLTEADQVVTVSWSWAEDFRKLGAKKVKVITNGFDEEDFKGLEGVSLSENFELTHIGSLNNDRNPEVLWQVLRELCTENKTFAERLSIKFVGKVDISVLKDIHKYELDPCLKNVGYVSHGEACRIQASSQILLLPINNTPNLQGIIPGKLFEYLAAGRPILCIGPGEGDTAKIVRKTGAGAVVGFREKEKLKQVLTTYFDQYLRNTLFVDTGKINTYSRKQLTGDLARELDGLV